MADFKTADICGASPNLNSVLEKMDSLKSSLSSSLTLSPSALSSTLSTEVSALSSSLSSMIPELPSAPDVSLQAELTSLSNINISTPSGLLDYRSKLDSITNQFGDSLSSAGVSLDNLVSQVAPSIPSLPGAPSVDLCSVVPNFKLPDGATEATEAAAETLMADAPGVAEKVSEITANANITTVQTGLATQTTAIKENTLYSKATVTTEIRTESDNVEIVGETKREVQKPEDNFVETTITRSTTTKVKSESGGEEKIVVAERPRVYPKGNYNDRDSNIELVMNSAYPEVADFYNGNKKLSGRPYIRLVPFGSPLPLLEIPSRIQRIQAVTIDDPKCYFIKKDSGEVFRLPSFYKHHHIMGKEVTTSRVGYKRASSEKGNLKLNFSDTKGESTIELAGATSYAFIRITYESFNDYDPSFRDASS